jgi:hypothetical protein
VALEASAEGLGENLANVLIAECLSEYLVKVDITDAARCTLSKLIVVSPLSFVAQCCIGLADMLKCIHRTRRTVLVRVDFQGQLSCQF